MFTPKITGKGQIYFINRYLGAERMSNKANHKRYIVSEDEERSVAICLDCPLDDCQGTAGCGYLRARLAGKSKEEALHPKSKAESVKIQLQGRGRPCVRYVEINDEEYNIAELAEKCGRSREAVYKRIQLGWTTDEILQNHREGKKEQAHGGRLKFEYDGSTYTTDELAEQLGVTHSTILSRHAAGWSTQEILQGSRNNSGWVRLEYKGEMLSVRGIAQMEGVSPTALRRRLAFGQTLEEAISSIKRSAWHERKNPHPESERE